MRYHLPFALMTEGLKNANREKVEKEYIFKHF